MLRRLHVLSMCAAACRMFAMRRTGGMCATAWRTFVTRRCMVRGFRVGFVFICLVNPRRTRQCKATNQNKKRSYIFLSGTARQLEKWARNVIVSTIRFHGFAANIADMSPNRFESGPKGKCDFRASTNLHI